MPALEALLDRFGAANTQTFGISIDSVFCHANWAASLGGISLPLLADFHPKGEVAASFGLYLDDKGITDRATVIIDADGVVQHISSVTPAGERDIAEFARLCEEIDAAYEGDLPAADAPSGVPGGSVLYVRNKCGFSAATLAAHANLRLADEVEIRNVSADAEALAQVKQLTGKEQAPCLVENGEPLLESTAIIERLVTQATGLWSQ